jgi:molybdopterin synthase sulfur carrier subunit
MTASPRAISVRVLLLARYAELLGADAVELPVGPAATVAEVVDAVRRLPGGDALPSRVLCAVNRRQALPADRVSPGDELALLPPMAGG